MSGAGSGRESPGRGLLLGPVAALRVVNRAIERVLVPVAAVLMAAMLLTVGWTVLARLTGITAPWTEKVMLILLPLLAFTVAPIAYRRAGNVSLDLLLDVLPPRLRALHALALHLTILLLIVFALDLTLRKVGIAPVPLSRAIEALSGVDLSAVRPFRAKIKIPVLGIEWRTVYLAMPACFAAMLLVGIELALRAFARVLWPGPDARTEDEAGIGRDRATAPPRGIDELYVGQRE